MAPSDTYFETIKISKKTRKHNNAANGCNPINTPNDVATPLPPLNSAKTGKTCPIIEKMDDNNLKEIKKA